MVHEFGHYRFTDFTSLNKVRKELLNKNSLYPKLVYDEDNSEITNNLNDFKEYIFYNSHQNQNIYNMWHRIQNTLEDGYIEECCYAVLYGQLASGLSLVRQTFYNQTPTLAEMLSQYDVNKDSELLAMVLNSLLCYTRYGHMKYDADNPAEADSVVISWLSKIKTYARKAVFESDSSERLNYVNIIFIILWPLIKKCIEENASEDSASTESPKSSEYPKGTTRGIPVGEPISENGTELTESSENDTLEKDSDMESRSMDDTLDEIAKSVAKIDKSIKTEKATEEANHELNDELRKEAEGMGLRNYKDKLSSDPVKVTFIRNVEISDSEKLMYDRIGPECEKLANEMYRKMGFLKKVETQPMDISGFYTGSKFDASRVVYGDWKYFKNEAAPIPERGVVFSILVDESGSMYERIEAATKATLTFYLFCQKCGLPCSVVGHTSVYGTVDLVLKSYADFDTPDSMDKYRICSIFPKSENRDGAAIEYVGNRLLKRPEKKKILISISDGRPAATGYTGNAACEDTKKRVSELRRQGVTVFTAAVGDDKDQIQKIYGEGFMDISDLSLLPQQLLDLAKRFIRK
jgi:hypothetical protein